MNESDVRTIIEEQLELKGWHLQSRGSNLKTVWQEGATKTKEQKKLLGGKRTDYILYRSSLSISAPIAIIEAKNRNKDLTKALDQARSYARKLNAPIVILYNSINMLTEYIPNGKPLSINGKLVKKFLSETELLKFIDRNNNEIIDSAEDENKKFISVLKSSNDLLRNAGVSKGMPRFGVLADIYFLKLIWDTRNNLNRKISWENIKEIPAESIIDHVKNITMPELAKEFKGDVFGDEFNLDNGVVLKKIMNLFSDLNLGGTNAGDAFQYFLHTSMGDRPTDFAEYFTPKILVDFLIKLAEPKIGEKSYDPFCGTGGITTSILLFVKEKMDDSQQNLDKWKTNTVFGGDITSNARIAKQMQILYEDGHNNINREDSLSRAVWEKTRGKFDCTITNIPFGISNPEEIDHLWFNTRNGSLLSVMHCLDSINPKSENGRVALICGDDVLEREGQFTKFREEIFKRANLHSIISLPEGAFAPYTDTSSNVLYFTNVGNPTEQRPYQYYSIDNVDDLEESLNLFIEHKDVGHSDFELIGIESIKNRGYRLSPVKINNIEGMVPLSELVERSIEKAGDNYAKYICGGITIDLLQKQNGGLTDPSKSTNKRQQIVDNNPGRKILPPDYFVCRKEGADTGYFSLNHTNDTYTVSNAYEVFFVKDKDKVYPPYLLSVLISDRFGKHIREQRIKYGVGRSSIKWKDLATVPVPLPSIEVQREIGDGFFEKIDKLLSLEKEKEKNEKSDRIQYCGYI